MTLRRVPSETPRLPSRLQHPDVQIGLDTLRQFDKAKTLAGVKPHHFGVDSGCGSGRRTLKVTWLGRLVGKRNCVIVMAMPAWLTMVLIFAHDRPTGLNNALRSRQDNLNRSMRSCQFHGWPLARRIASRSRPTCCHTRSTTASEHYMRRVELPIGTLPYIARQKVRTEGRQRRQPFDRDMPRAAASRGCASTFRFTCTFPAQPAGEETGSSSLDRPARSTPPARPRGANSAGALGRPAGSPARPPGSRDRHRS